MSVIALPQADASERPIPQPGWLTLIARRRTTLLGAILMVFMVALGVLAPLIAGNPSHMDVAGRLAAPSRAHWLGTDDVGREVGARTVYGARAAVPGRGGGVG